MQRCHGNPVVARQTVGTIEVDGGPSCKPVGAVMVDGHSHALRIGYGDESSDIIGPHKGVVTADVGHTAIFVGNASHPPPRTKAMTTAGIAESGHTRQEVGMDIVGTHDIFLLDDGGNIAGQSFTGIVGGMDNHLRDARMARHSLHTVPQRCYRSVTADGSE